MDEGQEGGTRPGSAWVWVAVGGGLAVVGVALALGLQPHGVAQDEVRVPAGFKAAAPSRGEPYTRTGWADRIVHERTGIEMVYIPAGTFAMGSAEYAEGHLGDDTRHEVRISRGFYMGTCER